MKSSKVRRWLFVVAFNVLVIGMILGAAELAVRLVPGSNYNQDEQLAMCRPDALTIWRYRPNVSLSYRASEFDMRIRTSEDGLRGERFPRRTTPRQSSSWGCSPSAGVFRRISAAPGDGQF
jgi:hypothetical protein